MNLRLRNYEKKVNLTALFFGVFATLTREAARPIVKSITGLSDKIYEGLVVEIAPTDIAYIGVIALIVCSALFLLNQRK